jgi:2',3'-cyclic-nucleotide 2'-phosphodiesterase/3'-nucleotidase
MEAIGKQKTLAPKPNHNWRFVPENWVNEAAKRDYEILFGKGSRPSAGK